MVTSGTPNAEEDPRDSGSSDLFLTRGENRDLGRNLDRSRTSARRASLGAQSER